TTRARSGQVVTRALPKSRRNGLTQACRIRPTRAASRSLRAMAPTMSTVRTVTTIAIPPISKALFVDDLAGSPTSTQTSAKSPGPAKTSASVSTLTPTVAPAKRSVLTPQLRSTTYWVAVPEGPGITLLTADDDSRAISERGNDRPGMRGT